jgi:hypothetical protein
MLVSVTDVRRYLGGPTIPEGMTSVLEDVIVRAQKMVETILNRPVERVQVREVVRSDSKGFLYLSVTPVWEVLSCGGTTAANLPDSDTPYTMVPSPSLGDDPRLIDKAPTKVVKNQVGLYPGRLYVGLPNSTYLIEYIGGLDPEQIEDIKRVIIQISAREWGMYNIQGAGLTGGTPDMADRQDGRGLSISTEEMNMIRRYRRRVAM